MGDDLTRFSIAPSYDGGFLFSWDVSDTFNDSTPWKFTVQEANNPTGDWHDVLCVDNVFMASDGRRRIPNKESVLYFRVVLSTPDGTYISKPVQPYGELPRREFLLAREIMRKEVLHCRKLAGTLNKVYLVSNTGPLCKKCRDPITGRVRDSHCHTCLGTGRNPPYHGPYPMWMSFSPDAAHAVEQNDTTGNTEQKSFEARAIGILPIKKNDVVVDVATDKRYYVDIVKIVSEIRRVPVVQVVTMHEAATTDPVYKVTT